MAQNEFVDDNGRIGFTKEEIEPFKFLTLDKELQSKDPFEVLSHVTLVLSDNKYFSERKAYKFFTLLGDFGGFNSAIIIFPIFLLSRYNSYMYNAAIMTEIPIRKLQKKKQETSLLRQKLQAGTQIEPLTS